MDGRKLIKNRKIVQRYFRDGIIQDWIIEGSLYDESKIRNYYDFSKPESFVKAVERISKEFPNIESLCARYDYFRQTRERKSNVLVERSMKVASNRDLSTFFSFMSNIRSNGKHRVPDELKQSIYVVNNVLKSMGKSEHSKKLDRIIYPDNGFLLRFEDRNGNIVVKVKLPVFGVGNIKLNFSDLVEEFDITDQIFLQYSKLISD
jgi:hypothetical protein